MREGRRKRAHAILCNRSTRVGGDNLTKGTEKVDQIEYGSVIERVFSQLKNCLDKVRLGPKLPPQFGIGGSGESSNGFDYILKVGLDRRSVSSKAGCRCKGETTTPVNGRNRERLTPWGWQLKGVSDDYRIRSQLPINRELMFSTDLAAHEMSGDSFGDAIKKHMNISIFGTYPSSHRGKHREGEAKLGSIPKSCIS